MDSWKATFILTSKKKTQTLFETDTLGLKYDIHRAMFSLCDNASSLAFSPDQLKEFVHFLNGILNVNRAKLLEEEYIQGRGKVAGFDVSVNTDGERRLFVRVKLPGTKSLLTLSEQDAIELVRRGGSPGVATTAVPVPIGNELLMACDIPFEYSQDPLPQDQEQHHAGMGEKEKQIEDGGEDRELQDAIDSISGPIPQDLLSEVSQLNEKEEESRKQSALPSKKQGSAAGKRALQQGSESAAPPPKAQGRSSKQPKLGPDGQPLPKRIYNRKDKKQQPQQQQQQPAAVFNVSFVPNQGPRIAPQAAPSPTPFFGPNGRKHNGGFSDAELAAGSGPNLGIGEKECVSSEDEDDFEA